MGQNSSVRYLESIGKGSFGDIFKGRWNGQMVAVKGIHRSLHYEVIAEKFRKEARIMRELKHDHIVKLLHVEEEERFPILIFELLKCDLETLVKNSQTDPKVATQDVASIMRDVAEGLLDMHEKGIIHRDITPKNILVDSENRAKIAGFGCSAMEHDSRDPVPGTPPYMAPETFVLTDSSHARYGKEIDIYSLGRSILDVTIDCSQTVAQENPLADDASNRRHRVQSDLDKMGETHPLRGLVSSCLEENPQNRTTALDIITQLEDPDFTEQIIEFELHQSVTKVQNAFRRLIPVRTQTIEEANKLNLEEMATTLDEHHRNVNIATAAGATTSVLATGVAVGGFVASFFTFGATIPVTIAGSVVAGAGGLTMFGSKTAEIVLSKCASNEIMSILKEDESACTAIRQHVSYLDDIIFRYVKERAGRSSGSSQGEFDAEAFVKSFEEKIGKVKFENKLCDPIVGTTRGLGAAVGVATSASTAGIAGARVGASVAFDSLTMAARATHIMGVVMSLLTVPLDLYFLVKSCQELINRSPSEVAEKIREIQSSLLCPKESEIADMVNMYAMGKVIETCEALGSADSQ